MKSILEYATNVVENVSRLNGHTSADFQILAAAKHVTIPWAQPIARMYGDGMYSIADMVPALAQHDRKEREYAFASWYERMVSGAPGASFWGDTGMIGLYHAAADVNNGFVESLGSKVKAAFLDLCVKQAVPMEVAYAFHRTFDVALAVMQECYMTALLDGAAQIGINDRLLSRIRVVQIRKTIEEARSSLPVIEWSDSLSTNVTEVDVQHRKLIDIINALRAAGPKGGEAMRRIMKELTDYTVFHFGFEEKMLSDNGYPEFPEHKRAHDKLVAQVGQLNNEVQVGKASVTVDLFKFLRSWLNNHIRGTDRRYSSFLNGKGIH
ncbi:MAG TPA: bacteriohemerythrin [Kofleriaceae bacterium]|nr:bacteriohemerythrin [Kofleriaceae bacterium]